MSDQTHITVCFTCHVCGLQRVRVLVPVRTQNEDLTSSPA
jgi:hypothetical protein